MTAERPEALDPEGLTRHLPRHIAVLGLISLLTAMSSAMVYGLLRGRRSGTGSVCVPFKPLIGIA